MNDPIHVDLRNRLFDTVMGIAPEAADIMPESSSEFWDWAAFVFQTRETQISEEHWPL